MRYDISKPTAPAMPSLGKGTECIKILRSQASKDNHEPFVPMLFPVLGAHISGAEFQYPDNSWKELTGMMANLVANSVNPALGTASVDGLRNRGKTCRFPGIARADSRGSKNETKINPIVQSRRSKRALELMARRELLGMW